MEVGDGGGEEPPSEGWKKSPPAAEGSGGSRPPKRQMKSPYQLEILEKTYAEETYPSESTRQALSVKIGLSDRQLQMWFCHRRLKDRKPQPSKRQRREELLSVTPPPVLPPLQQSDVLMGPGSGGIGSSSSSYMGSGGGESRKAIARTAAAVSMRGLDMPMYYEQPGLMSRPQTMQPFHLSSAEYRLVQTIEAQLGEPPREDGPILGVEFDPLPPGAFGAPIEMPTQPKQPARCHDGKILERHDRKATKASNFLPTMEHSLFFSSPSVRKKTTASGSHSVHPPMGSRALHEYQFLPEQPTVRSETYDRVSQSHLYDSTGDSPSTKVPSSSTGHLLHGTDHGQMSSASILSQHSRQQMFSCGSTEYDNAPKGNSLPSPTTDSQYALHQVIEQENPYSSSDRRIFRDEDTSKLDSKRKIDEARIAKEVEAHEKRIRKELEKQDILRRKREEQMRKEMERHDRERRKEEERMMREKQKEEERFQREQRRLLERKEKFLLKESRKAEKMRQKEEMRREKEAAKLKAANERATARRIAREYMELVEDERLELMELAVSAKELPSILALDNDTLQQLDSFRDLLTPFPPSSIQLKKPFAIQPWTDSEDSIANLLKVWKFFITFADVLGLWSFTLDEFVQALHDYESRLLAQLHVVVLKTIIKDIEDVARIPANALGSSQSSAVNPLGGHPHIVEGAYAWGFDICSWQRHLNYLTWPEVLRQLALAAGFGPQLKKRNVESTYFHDENEGNDTKDIIISLRNGSAAQNAVTLMRERGYTTRRRSRHRLTPGTVKFAAFHVLSLEGSKGLTILEVAEKIQKSGLRDLTTSKTPEASIAAALSRDTKLFERTAPSTYCVRTPYRKDPAEADAILSAAREKIQVFQNALSDSDDAEKETEDVDDAEREEDSEGDAAADAEVDDAVTEPKHMNEHLENKLKHPGKMTLLTKGKEDLHYSATGLTSQTVFDDDGKALSLPPKEISKDVSTSQAVDINSNCQESGNDMEDTEVDENNSGEPWVESLSGSDYSDLCVEERLNALVALIGVANQGNTLRIVLEGRLEAATALKKQMWSEAQLDRRRFRDEYSSRVQYNIFRNEGAQANGITEGSQTPLDTMDRENDVNLDAIDIEQLPEQHNGTTPTNTPTEKNSVAPEASAIESLQIQQYGYGHEKSRSQIKSYIGHKAEQLYVYRSLPLGQDRRRNRYWQFSTSTSPNDPGSGRIFFESRDGHWRVIDSEEVFDGLMAALDTRGIRESHLHSMLQRIEPTFKEAIKRRKRRTSELYFIPDITTEFPSPSSSPYGAISEALGELASFHIELARNDVEKDAALRRYHGFLRWMWRECYNAIVLCAIKYGKKRCSELLQTCESCYQSFLSEEKHCPSCHKTFKGFHTSEAFFSDHAAHCEKKRKADPHWKPEASDSSLPIGLVLLKSQLSIIEVSVPADALLPFWTEGYRKSWGVKLHSSSSAEEIFQILTLLEGAIKRDCLSTNFETTNELLNSSTPIFASDSAIIKIGSVPVLPWVPNTIAAVALRLLDLDSSISYMMQHKMESQKEKMGESIKLPSHYVFVKSTQELDLMETSERVEYQNERTWLDSGSGRRSRGRGSRGNRGGRGRGRGSSRGLRGSGSVRAETKGEHANNFEKVTGKYSRRGRTRGRGQKRGRRSARPRQISQGKMAAVAKDAVLRGFSIMSSSGKQERTEESSRSSGEDWRLKQRTYIEEDDDNSTGYQSDENGHASEEEYDDQMVEYARDDYDEIKPTGLMDDDMEDDEMEADAEGDEDIEVGEQNENDMDVDMDEDEIEDDADFGDDAERCVNEDEEGSSFSSEYSD